ncbi:hypothetical protein NDU88_011856 [Pleurodeles waltl]|uniref:Uncharacterized protein n=1 Tax=Pleurodeles waltl TaxID=8319 RepID=A0AAV7R296_PLEWA|nr:hypothetical protein NDU88_011856 [Pleurodeles waltl]
MTLDRRRQCHDARGESGGRRSGRSRACGSGSTVKKKGNEEATNKNRVTFFLFGISDIAYVRGRNTPNEANACGCLATHTQRGETSRRTYLLGNATTPSQAIGYNVKQCGKHGLN